MCWVIRAVRDSSGSGKWDVVVDVCRVLGILLLIAGFSKPQYAGRDQRYPINHLSYLPRLPHLPHLPHLHQLYALSKDFRRELQLRLCCPRVSESSGKKGETKRI